MFKLSKEEETYMLIASITASASHKSFYSVLFESMGVTDTTLRIAGVYAHRKLDKIIEQEIQIIKINEINETREQVSTLSFYSWFKAFGLPAEHIQ